VLFWEYPEFKWVDACVRREHRVLFVFQYVSLAFLFLFYDVAEYACFVLFVVVFAGFDFFLNGFGREWCGNELAVGMA
jgi:hypothetical protein